MLRRTILRATAVGGRWSRICSISTAHPACIHMAQQPGCLATMTSTAQIRLPRRYFSVRPEDYLDNDLKERLKELTECDRVVIFMKGTPEEPLCGYSKAVCLIMKLYEVAFSGVNVLDDEEIRQGIKLYSRWETIPQVFINGEFVGGCDVLLEMHESNEINRMLEMHDIPFRRYTK